MPRLVIPQQLKVSLEQFELLAQANREIGIVCLILCQ